MHRKPVIRQKNVCYIIIHFIIFWGFVKLFQLLNFRDSFLDALYLYFILSLITKIMIPRHQRRGMRLYYKGKYESAIDEFVKSKEFFKKHKWIDKYRVFVMLSSSRMSYLEMAQLNIAYCYTQLGNGEKALQEYESIKSEFPNNEIAEASIKMLNSMKQTEEGVNSNDIY